MRPKYKRGYELYHHVAKKAKNALLARKIMIELFRDSCETPENKVWVTTSVHRRLHTKIYYGYTNGIVINVYRKGGSSSGQRFANVLRALGD